VLNKGNLLGIPYNRGMIDWITGQPFFIAAGFLTLVAGVRSQCMFWLGRGIRAGVIRTAWAQKFRDDKSKRAVNRLQAWGWPLIPVSFLTIGFQTAVQISAGLIGWRWLTYTLAAIPGWILWGCAYAAGGLAAFVGLVTLARQEWWLAVLAVLVVAAIVVVIVRLRRSRTQTEDQDQPVGELVEAE